MSAGPILCAILIAVLGIFYAMIGIGERMKEIRPADIKARFGMHTLHIVIVVFYFALSTVSRTVIGVVNSIYLRQMIREMNTGPTSRFQWISNVKDKD